MTALLAHITPAEIIPLAVAFGAGLACGLACGLGLAWRGRSSEAQRKR